MPKQEPTLSLGGVDPVTLVDRYADRIRHVHFADTIVDTRDSTELGKGDLDLDTCVDAVARADVAWYSYEHDNADRSAHLACTRRSDAGKPRNHVQ